MRYEIPKGYEPQEIEERWAGIWFELGLYRADPSAPGPVFSVVIPPPNVTGSLHIGHMLEHTEIDILTRWHRMRGYNALYLPGMDHAGIGTQVVVERELAKENLTRQQVGRDEFERRIWKWKAESGGTIKQQMIRLGESCDWSRERFTLDGGLSRAVREVFVRLYEEGLIYRGHYMVNWCPRCQTALSDLEIEHSDHAGKLWHIRYPLADHSEYLVVATTRPETMLGDTALAVHPEDERYARFIGRTVTLPLAGREIPVIADAYVDREFGTGVVKITPAHDPNDFEVGRRHGLDEINVMTGDAHMNQAAGKYAGLDRFAARKQILADLEEVGLLDRVTDHVSAIARCGRCKTVVEPRASTQWFVRMKPLAEPAIKAIESGAIQIIPEFHRATYFEWMRNIRDWCISRQLWWGHRIPAWHCGKCDRVIVARETPAQCDRCSSNDLRQDPDVLDTWFSSSLWPFSTLGWPEETLDFKTYYPTSLLITGYDILFFWVARMIMMGLKFTGRPPFRQVHLHSLVRTPEGSKMSKAKGTGIDPSTINARYGTDAIRFTLASMAAPGTDIVLSEDRMQSGRAFANKIWNAARFLFVNLEKTSGGDFSLDNLSAPAIREAAPYAIDGEVSLIDRWIFSRIESATRNIDDELEEFRFHEAAHVIYHFFWGDFCDWYIEWVKPLLTRDASRAIPAWRNLFAVLEVALRLLHPFMPFLTEELWQRLPQRPDARSISLGAFPKRNPEHSRPDDERAFSILQEIIVAARNIRAEMKIDAKGKVAADFHSENHDLNQSVKQHLSEILRLADLSELRLSSARLDPAKSSVRSSALFELGIPMSEGLDIPAEIARLRKEEERIRNDIASKRARLSDQTFRSRAPEVVVRQLETMLTEREAAHARTLDRLKQLDALK
jgi:valyl-tRNA synthetase